MKNETFLLLRSPSCVAALKTTEVAVAAPWLGSRVQLQERRQRLQECSELVACLDHGEAHAVNEDGLDMSSKSTSR
ncbi:hypothetical protein E2C01_043237 [Portunus trituberculatus]|uniref:Uncharacterized protein n=1 Tax=Portunus trituberculatus TaxID=210409 RepID=A0A5B7FX06_PORTR|nr:hypothetical protein [Portunus trituberculatus]